jgi:hypothetical protein
VSIHPHDNFVGITAGLALSGLSTTMLIRHRAQLETTAPQDVTDAAIYTLHLLARRILALSEEVHDLEQRLTDTITSHIPVCC